MRFFVARDQGTSSSRRLASLLTLFIACACAGPVFAQRASSASVPDPEAALDRSVGARIARAALDPGLLPWQRDLMERMAASGRGSGPIATPEVASRSGITSLDGKWGELPPPAGRAGQSAILDPIGRRVLIFGGSDGLYRDNVWVSSLNDSSFSDLEPAGPLPAARAGHVAIYDPIRRRMVVFGGTATGYLNDVWTLNLVGAPQWTPLTIADPKPGPRTLASAVYDSVGDRMIVFGGRDDAGAKNDAWSLSLSGTPAWSLIQAGGTAPGPRYGQTSIYDPLRNRVVVFGGFNGVDRNNEVWELKLSGSPAWNLLKIGGPFTRYLHGAIYDQARDRMVIFGGFSGAYLNDTWSLAFSGTDSLIWRGVATTGTTPTVRAYSSLIYDPASDFMIAYGGYAGSYRDDHQRLLLGVKKWFNFTTVTLPSGLHGHAAAYDAQRDRMLVFGGSDGIGLRNQLWAHSLNGSQSWSQILVGGTAPSSRADMAAVYDPIRDQILIFGGWDGDVRNDLWSVSLASPSWNQVTTLGLPPPRRSGASAVYDPVGDRVIVFGGMDSAHVYRGDAWSLALSDSMRWSPLLPDGSGPSGRTDHSAIYDPFNRRMVVFGGWQGFGLGDVWALALEGTVGWSQVVAAGGPTGRYDHTAVADLVRERMLVFGGSDGNDRSDVWALSLGASPAWSQLASTGRLVDPRHGHVAIYDPIRDRLEISGGLSAASTRKDTWALDFASPFNSALTCPPETPWAPGDSVTLTYTISNPFGFAQQYGYTLQSTRNWPGFPIRGSGEVPPNTNQQLHIRAPVPDSAAGGKNGLTFSALLRNIPQSQTCVDTLREPGNWVDLTALAGTAPSPRSGHSAISLGDRMIVFGGGDLARNNEVWQLSLTGTPTWTPITPAGTPPAPRASHTAIFDPPRNRMIVFGGVDGSTYYNDVWELTFNGAPTWNQLAPTGTAPFQRSGSCAVYDPVRDRMIVFGGFLGGVSLSTDIWVLSLSGTPAWTQLTATGAPPTPREGMTASYDPVADRLFIFGGRAPFGASNETWQLDLTTASPAWTNFVTPGSILPDVRTQHGAIYDLGRKRLVVYGGFDSFSAVRNDAWVLSPGAKVWAKQNPNGTAPAGRYGASAIYDVAGDRMIIFGGEAGGTRFNDLQALAWDRPTSLAFSACPGTSVWPEGTGRTVHLSFSLSSPYAFAQTVDYQLHVARDWPGFPLAGNVAIGPGGTGVIALDVAVPDSAAPGTNAFALVATSRVAPDRVTCNGSLSAASSVTGVAPVTYRFALGGAIPNPAARNIAVVFSLANRDPASLEVFDLSGRRVWSRRVDDLGPGGHVISLRDLPRHAPGVYMIRLTEGPRRLTARAVLME